MREIPTIECRREGLQLVFACPHCWHMSGLPGVDDYSEYYKSRPKRAKAMEHVHTASPGEIGNSDGHVVAGCLSRSPLRETGYYLYERRPATVSPHHGG